MSEFNRDRKAGGFGGTSKYKGHSDDHGSVDRSSGRGGFGSRNAGGERGSKSFGAPRNSDRPAKFKAVCSECGKNCEVPFKPSGLKPVLCSSCFSVQQGGDSRDFGSRGSSREKNFEKRMFDAVCEGCGNKCEVPFKPVEGKSVFCSDCFRGSDNVTRVKNVSTNETYQEQFTSLNGKLDQILKALNILIEQKEAKELKIPEAKEAPKIEKLVVVKIAKAKVVKKITKQKA